MLLYIPVIRSKTMTLPFQAVADPCSISDKVGLMVIVSRNWTLLFSPVLRFVASRKILAGRKGVRIMDNERENFDFELVSHEGSPLKPARDSRGTQRYMGALEENMQVVVQPSYDNEDEQSMARQAHKQQTPG